MRRSRVLVAVGTGVALLAACDQFEPSTALDTLSDARVVLRADVDVEDGYRLTNVTLIEAFGPAAADEGLASQYEGVVLRSEIWDGPILLEPSGGSGLVVFVEHGTGTPDVQWIHDEVADAPPPLSEQFEATLSSLDCVVASLGVDSRLDALMQIAALEAGEVTDVTEAVFDCERAEG